MNRFFAITLGLLLGSMLVSQAAVAGGLVMTDPASMSCKYIQNPGYAACNLWYDGALIYEGPTRGPADANADCAVCRNFRAAAIKGQRHVYLDRTLNWGDYGFLTLTDDDVPPPPMCN